MITGLSYRGYAMATSGTDSPHWFLIKGSNLTRLVIPGTRMTVPLDRRGHWLGLPSYSVQSHTGSGGHPGGVDGDNRDGSSSDSMYDTLSADSMEPSSCLEEESSQWTLSNCQWGTHTSSRHTQSGNCSTLPRMSGPYWSTASHTDSYWEKGSCCPSRYLRNIHAQIHRQVNNKAQQEVHCLPMIFIY